MKSNFVLISHPIRYGDSFALLTPPFKPTKDQKWIRYSDRLYYIQRYYTSFWYFLTEMQLVHKSMARHVDYELSLIRKRKSFYERTVVNFL